MALPLGCADPIRAAWALQIPGEGGQRGTVSEVQGPTQGLSVWLLGGNGLSHAKTPTVTYERQSLQCGKNAVCQFTIAAITNDHKPGSLKQHKFIS